MGRRRRDQGGGDQVGVCEEGPKYGMRDWWGQKTCRCHIGDVSLFVFFFFFSQPSTPRLPGGPSSRFTSVSSSGAGDVKS